MRIRVIGDARSVHVRRWCAYLRDHGDEVSIWSVAASQLEGVIVRGLATRHDRRLLPLLLFNLVGSKDSYDVAHAHYLTSFGLVAAVAGQQPLVATAWGSDVLQVNWIKKPGLRMVVASAARLTAVARHLAEALWQHHPRKPVEVIPFGTDLGLFRSERPSEARDIDVISTRHLEPLYGVDLLFRALTLLPAGRDYRCLIVGEGSQRAGLERASRSLPSHVHVEFAGWLTEAEVASVLGRAKVFVSTSPQDGNNVSLNEAMAAGCFPVVRDIGANRFWIEQGVNGTLFPGDARALSEALVDALREPVPFSDVARHNWTRVSTFGDRQANFARLRTLLESVT